MPCVIPKSRRSAGSWCYNYCPDGTFLSHVGMNCSPKYKEKLIISILVYNIAHYYKSDFYLRMHVGTQLPNLGPGWQPWLEIDFQSWLPDHPTFRWRTRMAALTHYVVEYSRFRGVGRARCCNPLNFPRTVPRLFSLFMLLCYTTRNLYYSGGTKIT